MSKSTSPVGVSSGASASQSSGLKPMTKFTPPWSYAVPGSKRSWRRTPGSSLRPECRIPDTRAKKFPGQKCRPVACTCGHPIGRPPRQSDEVQPKETPTSGAPSIPWSHHGMGGKARTPCERKAIAPAPPQVVSVRAACPIASCPSSRSQSRWFPTRSNSMRASSCARPSDRCG